MQHATKEIQHVKDAGLNWSPTQYEALMEARQDLPHRRPSPKKRPLFPTKTSTRPSATSDGRSCRTRFATPTEPKQSLLSFGSSPWKLAAWSPSRDDLWNAAVSSLPDVFVPAKLRGAWDSILQGNAVQVLARPDFWGTDAAKPFSRYSGCPFASLN